ncbi:MAG: hypothetical protein PHE89_06180 [Alphaproteobacteria bacterium]|nr:hypothetical protein [Alphaproteobacteria bacterium]
MKKIIPLMFCLTVFCASPVFAKFNPPPEGYRTISDKMTDGYFNKLNETQDGKMTLDEYKARDLTREDRRNMRKDQKSGNYKTDAQVFEEMDEDKDGFVTKEEMNAYIRKVRKDGRNFY